MPAKLTQKQIQEWRDCHAAIEAESRDAALLSILNAVRAEMELFAKFGLRVPTGRLELWIHEVRRAAELATERES